MNKFFVKTSAKVKEVLKTEVYFKGELEKEASGLYTGSVEENLPHGPGHLELFNGSEYIGDFFEGKFHGKGVYTHIDGSRFQGTFENGEKIDPYPQVVIGNQIWMKKNLNVDKFRNGDPIPHIKSDKEWLKAGGEGKPAWCYYDNDPENGKKYGKLYNWFAVNDPRGLAPEGWHVASDDEWTHLTDFLGGGEVAGTKIKSLNEWKNSFLNTDDYEYSALPSGKRYGYGDYDYIGNIGVWWSSTEESAKYAWVRRLGNFKNMIRDPFEKRFGLSVRCVRDIDYSVI